MDSFTDLDVDARALLLGATGVAVTAAVAYALYSFLAALVFAVFAYYASRPVYRHLIEYTDHPNVAATATILAYTLPVVVLLGYGLFLAAQQLDGVLAQGAGRQYRSMLSPYLTLVQAGDPATWQTVFQNPGQVVDQSTRRLLSRGAGPAATAARLVVSVLAQAFLALVFLFYLLRDDQHIAGWFRDVVNHDPAIVGFVEGVDGKLATVFFGNLLTIVATSAIATAVYWGLDLAAPAGGGIAIPVFLGALTGLGTLVPGVGMKLVYVPYGSYLTYRAVAGDATPLWLPVAFFALSLVVVDTIPDYYVRSYLSSGDIALGFVMLAYILGPMVWGWVGLFLGPILLVVFLQFAHDVLPSLTSGHLRG